MKHFALDELAISSETNWIGTFLPRSTTECPGCMHREYPCFKLLDLEESKLISCLTKTPNNVGN